MNQELEAELARTQKLVKECRADAERALAALFETATAHLRSELSIRVHEFVKLSYSVTLELEEEGRLDSLKAGLVAFYESLPAKIREWLDHDRLWRHREGFGRLLSEQPDRVFRGDYKCLPDLEAGPGLIARTLQEGVNSILYPLFVSYGYTVRPAHFPRDDFKIGWRGDLENALNEYAQAFESLLTARNEHNEVARLKGQYDAKQLWEKQPASRA